MNDIDLMWDQMMEKAIASARNSGRNEVADYLDLRSRNDVIRKTGVRWLFDALIRIAAEHNRDLTLVTIDRVEPHSFSHGPATLAGSMLELRQGVRCLAVEAGWTRTPADGFMRGGALAVARLRHFGMVKQNAELHLRATGESAGWIAVAPDTAPVDADETFLRRHFTLLVGED